MISFIFYKSCLAPHEGTPPKIYINPERGLFLFYANNEEIALFDLESKLNLQNPMMYISVNDNTLINDFTISKWSGKKPSSRQTTVLNKDDDKIRLKNGDVAYGQIISINKETLRFKSVLGDLNIPVTNIDQILFQNSEISKTQTRFTLAKGPLQISGDITYKNGSLYISNSYLLEVPIKKEYFSTLSRYVKPNQTERLTTINIGKSIIKGKHLHLKDSFLKIENDNLISQQALNNQKLKTIQFSGNQGDFTPTASNRESNQRWAVELTNGDTLKTSKFFLSQKGLTLHLGNVPLTIPLQQVKAIKVIQDVTERSSFLQNLSDRYSLNFRLNLTDDALKMLQGTNPTDALFYLNCRTPKNNSTYFQFSAEIIIFASSVNQKLKKWEVKSHNKMTFKKQNDFQIKIDHKKNRFEVWGNKQLINSSTGEINEKFKHININVRNEKYATVENITFRPSKDNIKSKNYIIDTKMNLHEGPITFIDQKQISINGKNILLKDIHEIILGHKDIEPDKNSQAIITTKNARFHVDNLTIEDSDIFFSLHTNKNISLPLNTITNITFIKQP